MPKGGILELTKAVHNFRDNSEQVLDAIELKRPPIRDEAWIIQFYRKHLLSAVEPYLPQEFSIKSGFAHTFPDPSKE